jgi:hypothetical protein
VVQAGLVELLLDCAICTRNGSRGSRADSAAQRNREGRDLPAARRSETGTAPRGGATNSSRSTTLRGLRGFVAASSPRPLPMKSRSEP